MKTIEKLKTYKASAEAVFDFLDDISVTGMHMTESSMPTIGGKLKLEFLSTNRKGLNTRYRWTGKVLWMDMDFAVLVSRWIKNEEKTWETVGSTRMIINSWFRMELKIKGDKQQSTARLSISYEMPKGIFNNILSFLLADWYCKWCLKNMLNDTEKKLMSAKTLMQEAS
jgi:hypothetical protein